MKPNIMIFFEWGSFEASKAWLQAFSQETLSLAFACKGSELSIWDLLKGERTYLAKSAKPSNIGLMDPSCNAAVAFLPGTKGSQIVVGTGMHKVRLYNTEQRRPTLSLDFGESRITALAPHTKGQLPSLQC